MIGWPLRLHGVVLELLRRRQGETVPAGIRHLRPTHFWDNNRSRLGGDAHRRVGSQLVRAFVQAQQIQNYLLCRVALCEMDRAAVADQVNFECL